MDKCKKCETQLDNYRIHLGYTECTDCSETEKYSAHTVYPHKTGGYIQPVSSAKKKHLTSIDRRSSTGNKPAKGIVADKSWDRWLKKYYEEKDNPKPKRTFIQKTPTIKYISMSKAESLVKDYYNNNGYYPTLDYCLKLYQDDKISMVMKNNLVNLITNQQMLPKRLRKWVNKIN